MAVVCLPGKAEVCEADIEVSTKLMYCDRQGLNFLDASTSMGSQQTIAYWFCTWFEVVTTPFVNFVPSRSYTSDGKTRF